MDKKVLSPLRKWSILTTDLLGVFILLYGCLLCYVTYQGKQETLEYETSELACVDEVFEISPFSRINNE